MWSLCLIKYLIVKFNAFSILTKHCGCYCCSLRCDGKCSTNFFSLLHNFTDRIFVLTRDLSNLSKQFVFLLTRELLLFQLKEAPYGFSLACVNCQHHYSYALGTLLSKVSVTWTQALQYCHNQSDNLDGYWVMGGITGQRDDSCPTWDEGEGKRFHHAIQTVNSLKLIVYFYSLPCNIFRPWLTADNRNLRKQNFG